MRRWRGEMRERRRKGNRMKKDVAEKDEEERRSRGGESRDALI